jgi:hypothetical protein
MAMEHRLALVTARMTELLMAYWWEPMMEAK